MLAALLSDKEASAMERAFRILAVMRPEERFDTVLLALRSDDQAVRESARELAGHVIPEPLRACVLALLGEGTAEARLFSVPKWAEPEGRARFERVALRLDAEPQKRTELLRELAELQSQCLGAMRLHPSNALRGVP